MATELVEYDAAQGAHGAAQSTTEETAEIIRLILRNLNRSKSWNNRSQVKKDELPVDMVCDDGQDDFLPELLPFKNHPSFLSAPRSMQKKILSCGWLAYNEKTVNIEAKIVAPACMQVVYGEAPGLQDWVSRQIAGQTLVDEAYHILLVIKACQITRERRGLVSVTLPESHLITKMEEYQERFSEKWQKNLIQMATAIVSEVFISDYLKLLSSEMSIQSFNRLTVETHRRDELAHSGIFKDFAKRIYMVLDKKEREFLMDVLPRPVRWFASLELNVWSVMLQQIGFKDSDKVISDCRSINETNLDKIDYSDLIGLAEELGMFNAERGKESFYREGLLD